MWLFVGKSENLSVGGIISLQMNIREGGGEIWNTSSSYCDHYLASFILFLQNIPWNDLLIRRQGLNCPKISEPLEEAEETFCFDVPHLSSFFLRRNCWRRVLTVVNQWDIISYHTVPYHIISYCIINNEIGLWRIFLSSRRLVSPQIFQRNRRESRFSEMKQTACTQYSWNWLFSKNSFSRIIFRLSRASHSQFNGSSRLLFEMGALLTKN